MQHRGGLTPPPAGRRRRATKPSSTTQHRLKKVYLHPTPLQRSWHTCMNRFAKIGEIAEPCGVPRSRASRLPSRRCMRRFQPPLHVQQDPPLVGVVGHRPENKIMIKVVEEPADVHIDHPVGSPTPLPAHRHRIQRATARSIAIRVGVENRLHLTLQDHRRHRLRDSVGHGGHPEHPDPPPRAFDLHHPYRRRKVACPTTSDSTAYRGFPSDPSRTVRSIRRPRPPRPCWP